MKTFLYIVGIIGTLIGLYFSVFKFIKHILNLAKRKKLWGKKAYYLIKAWFDYIDCNLSSPNLNFDIINHLENEISYFFSIKKNKKLTLKFNKKFRREILRGLKKELCDNIDFFKIYARLRDEDTPGLPLYELIIKRKVKLNKFPFEFYWWVILGNFYKFYSQYKINFENIPEDKKRTWADIEMPMKILKRIFER